MKIALPLLALITAFAVAPLTQATVLYDATGGVENGGDPLADAGPILANRFVSTITGKLDSVTLNLAVLNGNLGSFTVDLFTDAGASGPGAATLIATVRDTSLTSNFALYTFMPNTLISLVAGQAYYIGVTNRGSGASLGNTIDPVVLARGNVAAGRVYFNNGGIQANIGGPYEIIVNATAAPEPGTFALIGVGLATLGVARRRRRLV